MTRSHRHAALAVTLLALWPLAGCGSSTDTEEPPPPDPGKATLRFTNPTVDDVFVDETLGPGYAVTQGSTSFPGSFDCTKSCSECGSACSQCGAPLPLVRRIPAGGSTDYRWEGNFFERSECSDGCSCQIERVAARGAYEVRLTGALGYIGGMMPINNDPNVFSGDLDPASAPCEARGQVTLDGTEVVVEVPFACQ